MTGGFPDLWIILLIAVLLVAVLVVVAVIVLRGALKKEDGRQLTAPTPGKDLQLFSRPESPVAASFQSAIEVLRQKVSGSAFEYKVPWILMIGPPGSGKTSILDSLSASALHDNSAPSSKDRSWISWAFLNRGVVIDAPGSLLLGPSPNVSSDERAWDQMLHRFNRHRPARPLDGVVLTFPATDLLNPDLDIAAQGALIRAKLDSLQSAVGLVLPVYIVITKCDSIHGFGSFCREFEHTNPEASREIFGWSNEHTLESVFSWVWADEAMASLHRSIREHQLRFFGQEKKLDSPDALFLFPPEFQKLRDSLRSLLTQLFVPVSYRDSHYFRGVYFSGLPDESDRPDKNLDLVPVIGNRTRSPIFFLDHLFERKIFAERTLARPVAQKFQFRNRVVLGAQVFAALFSLLMLIGLSIDYFRLSNARDNRLLRVIDALAPSLELSPDRGSVDSAYSLAETFAFMHASGFKSAFMPMSWYDPIDGSIQSLLEQGFKNLVLAPFKTRLESDYVSLTSVPIVAKAQDRPDCTTPVGGQGSIWLSPSDSPEYQSLRAWMARVIALEQQIQVYERLRSYGSGSVSDILELLQYFTGRQLPDAKQYESNPYFTRAIQAVNWQDVDVAQSRANAAARTGQLMTGFFDQWFGNSILLDRVTCVQNSVQDFERSALRTTPQLRSLAGQIADLDQVFSSSSLRWLDEPVSMANDPVLEQFDHLKIVYGNTFQEMKAEKENEGQDAWQNLRSELMKHQTSAGTILVTGDPDRVHLSNNLLTLGNNLKYLVGLDFMTPTGSAVVSVLPNTPVFWNQASLEQALKVNETWQKYQTDVLVTAEPVLARPLHDVAQLNFIEVMTELVSKAHSPLTVTPQDDALLAELKNFNQTLEARKQIWQIGDAAAPAGNTLINSLGLYPQATRLLGAANARLTEDSYYSYNPAFLKGWDGAVPPSLTIYKASSPDTLTEDINSDHARLQTLVNAIVPLAQLVSPTLPVNPQWTRLNDDFKALTDKKPGNPISTVETFLHQDIDKITPENRCQASPADSRSGDPLINSLNTLRSDTVTACLMLLRQRYIALATLFHDHLAGKFPFSANPTTAAEADPKDVADFFALYDRDGASLTDTLDRLAALNTSYQIPASQAIAFLKTVGQVRPFFAAPDGTDIPILDVTPLFRSNRDREVGGNQIIFWQLKIGDQVYPYPATAKAIRWQYDDPVRLTLRYASDSPYVPAPNSPDASLTRTGDRELTYVYPNGWSLYRLLLARAASASDFDTARAVPNTIKLTFPNGPSASAPAGAKQPDDTKVFVSFTLQSPASKDPAAAKNGVVLSAVPVSAPVVP